MPELSTTNLMALAGLLCGLVAGLTARGARFCTFGAIEDALLVGKLARLKSWALAIACAMVAIQALHTAGIARIGEAIYLAPTFGWLGAIVGGGLFGLGMALVGTCGFGSIIRLGGGDLKSLVTFILMGLSAYMTARGLTGTLRQSIIEPWHLDLARFDGQGLPQILGGLMGIGADGLWLPMALAFAALVGWWCFSDAEFRRSRTDIAAALVIALTVVTGFAATGILGNDPFEVQRVESLTFVLPPGETLVYLMTSSGATMDFGVGLVLGTLAGAFAMAAWKGELRLEAFDDAREMRRHLLGAFLMGVGGVTALGCTIGQGVSGMATLSASAPLTLLCIFIGASFGLYYLMTGSLREASALAATKLLPMKGSRER